jgi:hypothetical protein
MSMRAESRRGDDCERPDFGLSVLRPRFQNSRTAPPWRRCVKASIVIVSQETRSEMTVLQGPYKRATWPLRRSKATAFSLTTSPSRFPLSCPEFKRDAVISFI